MSELEPAEWLQAEDGPDPAPTPMFDDGADDWWSGCVALLLVFVAACAVPALIGPWL